MKGKTHGLSRSPEYAVYQMAKHRCTNPNSQRWYTHGARGIQFKFNSFEEFITCMGPRPSSNHSLERENNDGHYEPGNVKWATRSEQQINKRDYTIWKRQGKGYYWHKASGKWMVRAKYMGKTIYGGIFIEEDQAIKKYAEILKELKEKHELHI